MKQILFLSIFALFFSACGEKPIKEQGKFPPLPVKAFVVKNESSVTSKVYPSILKAYEEVEVFARVPGVLQEKYFNEGDFVKKGDKLYLIEDSVYLANLNQAKAKYKKAKKDYKRAVDLLRTKSISDQSFDEYEFIYKDAESSLNIAQTEFDYTRIVSPIDGIVGIKQHNVGSLVGTSPNNSLVVTVTKTSPIHAEFSISQEDVLNILPQIKEDKVGVIINKGTEQFDGEFDFVSPKLDLNTSTLLVRSKFENEDSKLIVGEFLEVTIDNIDLGNVFLIPEESVLKTNKGSFVYVINKDNIAKITPVVIGDLTNEGLIIKQGLKEGDRIIITNIAKVRPETKVSIISEER